MLPAIKKANKSDLLNGEEYIDLTQAVKNKKAVINVKNKDNKCFEYPILSALHHDEIDRKHANRPSE